ncbi:hypothetical protein QML58_20740, partial [Providencia rettgeri]|nr:hypothetical protein [Providencia rettgeri]
TSWADSRLNSALKFRFFIKAPVLFWGEHITSVQVAKFIKPLQTEVILKIGCYRELPPVKGGIT